MSGRKRHEYDPETKAAVLAALLQGQGVSELARQYKIPAETIRSWKSRQLHGDGVAEVTDDTRRKIGELLHAYLLESLTTLTAQMVAFRDPDWLKGQDAHEVGVLHGILMDKNVRLLEALSRGPGGDGGDGQ